MKYMQKISLIFLICSTLSRTVTSAGHGLYVCNESGHPLNVAYAEFVGNIWNSHGWYPVENQSCKEVTAALTNTRYYVYAVATSKEAKTWTGNHPFCVVNGADFVIPYGDNTQACTSKGFFAVWVPSLVTGAMPDHYELLIGPNNVNLNNPRAER